MVLQVEFDQEGNIRSVAYVAPVESGEGFSAGLGRLPGEGLAIAYLEAEEVTHERDFEGLRTEVERYQVAGHPNEARLVRK